MEDYKLERCREPLQPGFRVKMNNIIFFCYKKILLMNIYLKNTIQYKNIYNNKIFQY